MRLPEGVERLAAKPTSTREAWVKRWEEVHQQKAKERQKTEELPYCTECQMFGHETSVHVKTASDKVIVAPGAVTEQLNQWSNRPHQGRFVLPPRGHNRGSLRQPGKLSTGIKL